MKRHKIITKATYKIPATATQGACTITGTESMMETARDNALWQYNDGRAHDGLAPVSALPPGTVTLRAEYRIEK